jgi:hypothetical protein
MPRSSGPTNRSSKQSIYQNLIDCPNPLITVEIVHESQLQVDHLVHLFDNKRNSLHTVGLAIAYSPSGAGLALAFCVDNRTLIVEMYSTKAVHDGKNSAPQNLTGREMLHAVVLAHENTLFYAFDIAPLTLLVYYYYQLHLTEGIDIQSALPLKTRAPEDATKFAVGEKWPVYYDNIITAFGNQIFEPAQVAALAQRAWLACYLANLDEIKDHFYKAPKINTKKLSEGVSMSEIL